MEKLIRFGVSMPDGLLKEFDAHIMHKGYSNRSEAFRDIVREKLIEQNIKNEKEEAFGILTAVYDHHQRDLSDRLAELQHDNYKSIISTTHIHIDHDNCLEVIIIKGKAGQIKIFSDKLLSFKGVKHCNLNLTSLSK